MSIGERLRELRGRRTLKEFSEPLGVSATAISNIENNRSEPSNDLTIKICDLYGCTMDWLIRGVGTKEGSPAKAQEPPSDYVTISKDELIQLQRQAIKNKDERIEDLLKQVNVAKNIEEPAEKK